MIHVLQFLFIGVIGGFLSGLLGIGGGVIFIPLLVYLGHTPIKIATSVSMVVIIFASASGLLAHHRARISIFPQVCGWGYRAFSVPSSAHLSQG